MNRLTNSSAFSATSRQPASMVSECPRPDILTISVTPLLRFCCLYDAFAIAQGTVWSESAETISIGPRSGFVVLTFASVHGLRFADAALAFIAGRGLSDRRVQLIWDLVALNSTPSLALHKEPEVAVGTMGIGLDYGGFGRDALEAGNVHRIVSEFPRLRMKDRFSEACCRLVTDRPETSHDNFLRDFGERFVPGYKAVSTVDLLMNAPFDE